MAQGLKYDRKKSKYYQQTKNQKIMAIYVKNLATGEVSKVHNVKVENGVIHAEGQCPCPKTRFFNNYPFMKDTGERVVIEYKGAPVEVMKLALAEGYELETKRQRGARTAPRPATSTEPTTAEVEPAKVTEPATASTADDEALQLARLLMNMKGGKASVNADEVRAIVREVLAEQKPQVVKVQVNNAEPKELPDGQTPHPLLPIVLKMVTNDRIFGRYPWLYGPAGSGKSTLAKQVADTLGLPFYCVSSLQQKYELEGYTDAAGELVKTSFYECFTKGGVFCFDEASTTSGEVQVAFNTAAAQLLYNFPKDGMVKAHPDFHIIASDNSTGRGGDKRYISRFQLDASTLDRYSFVKVDYTDEHDMRMALGDSELVDFMKDMRRVLDEANTTYLATPRASRQIATMLQADFTINEAVWYGLCSGWNMQDIRTFNARMKCSNRYAQAFNAIAEGEMN